MTPESLEWTERTSRQARGKSRMQTASVGAYVVGIEEDWAYSAVNGVNCYRPFVALRVAPGRPLLLRLWSGVGTPEPLQAARAHAVEQLPRQAALAQEVFRGLLAGVDLRLPLLTPDVSLTPASPAAAPPGRGAFIELD